MATVTVNYAASAAITCNCTSLASSATFTSGYESSWVDNTTNKYVDALLSGKVTVGTTPTPNTQILVYTVAMLEDSTYFDVFDGTESTETLTNGAAAAGSLKLAAVLNVPVNTAGVAYNFGPTSVAQLYGGVLPAKWGLFVTHNTGTTLGTATGSQVFYYKGIKYDMA
jgi:hypothetical protein